MTRADFYDWLIVNKCTIAPLPEDTRGNVIKVTSPHANSHVFLDTPINERPMRCFTVCTMCHQLYIPIPDPCKSIEQVVIDIKKRHYPNN
jgi:hypothetical protein